MSEYKRFIAYFYEYIDGKRQKNAGFAKVELRNGMWRLLFRLNTGILLDQPIQVYGFVRVDKLLLGVPMGRIHPDRQNMEDWAYRANAPIGENGYGLEDLSGIHIMDGSGRSIWTVWDDEQLQPEHFVLELPEAEPSEEEQENTESELMQAELEGRIEAVTPMVVLPEEQSNESVREEQSEEVMQESIAGEQREARMQEEPNENEGVMQESLGEEPSENEGLMQESLGEEPSENEGFMQTCMPREGQVRDDFRENTPIVEKRDEEKETGVRLDAMSELFQIRSHVQPFTDTELTDCVMILPCDITRLQQEKWQVGRSSFLQHGFYQYRHLLLGIMEDGEYVLGVPGIQNSQEQYMARMFGFEHFKPSKRLECGKLFGYWCSNLRKCNS
ncbi:MAG: hypothetical protein HFG96_09710 [Lachnospiraceae bacterium]|nr:hypothetical protein [Lachnospiraceae bacterium]